MGMPMALDATLPSDAMAYKPGGRILAIIEIRAARAASSYSRINAVARNTGHASPHSVGKWQHR